MNSIKTRYNTWTLNSIKTRYDMYMNRIQNDMQSYLIRI